MTKYLRETPDKVLFAPAHRFIKYVHGLNCLTPRTKEEYLQNWREDHQEESLEALEWLIERGLALTVLDK